MGVRVVEIRDPQSELIQEIIALEREAFGEPAALNEWTLPMLIANGKVFVLEVGGKAYGVAALLRQWSDPLLSYLVTFSIAKDRRRRGLGREFLGRILQRVREEGLLRVRLTVSPDNLPAHSLYERAGFQAVFFLRDYYGPGEDRLLMELRLDSDTK